MSTDIERSIQRGQLKLKDATSLAEVAKAMVSDTPPAVVGDEVQPFPALPGAIDITPEVKQALVDLQDVFGRVQPSHRKLLTDAEREALGRERAVSDVLIGLLTQRKKDIREIIYAGMDVKAERDGADPATSPRDEQGHYAIGGNASEYQRLPIPGTNTDFVRETKSARVTYDEASLARMEQLGKVTHDQYLALTREVRVFDEKKALLSMQRDPTLMGVFRKIVRAGRPSSALNVRKRK